MGKRKKKKEKNIIILSESNNQTEATSFSVDFKNIFFLLISLLQGTIFFAICDNVFSLFRDYSIKNISIVLLQFSMFFRIIQTHLLAAIDYSAKWNMKSLDFIMLFVTAFFEYLLTHLEKFPFNIDCALYTLIFAFSAFGIIGYIISLLRVQKGLGDKKSASREKLIQTINVVVLLVVMLLFTASLCKYIEIECAIFLTSGLLILNIFISMRLSRRNWKN